ncbi:MAG: dockerin type I repeat-containing protein [Ruminococcus sp.]|nr:dockerin type I repeat-containing protein [Ruminococcus sp.]
MKKKILAMALAAICFSSAVSANVMTETVVAAESDTTSEQATRAMTLNDVVELSKKGKKIDWPDFAEFEGKWRSTIAYTYFCKFDLGDDFFLVVGGEPNFRPEVVWLCYSDTENYVDVKTGDVKAFIDKNATSDIATTTTAATTTKPASTTTTTKATTTTSKAVTTTTTTQKVTTTAVTTTIPKVSYKLISLPNKLEYKVGENIDLKGIKIEVTTGNQTPVVYTYPEIAFAHESNTPTAPKLLLYTDFRGDKAGTYKVGLIEDENISFNVKVVENTTTTTKASATTTKATTTTAETTTTTASPSAKLNFKIIEINGNTLILTPDEGSPTNTPDKFSLPKAAIDSKVTPAVGMKLEIIWDGDLLETYPAQFGMIEKITVISEAPDILKGDTNCDGQVDMADVVLIMQALANPNKYGIDGTAEHHLTEQGKLSGDMDGDGLTVGDALAIQRKLLGLKDESSADASDIVTFEMEPSKLGVEKFLANNPKIANDYEEDELYNITPSKISEKYGFTVYKFANSCESYLDYKGKAYSIGTGFGGPGTIAFAAADINKDGNYEFYYIFSYGSGTKSSEIGFFDASENTKFYSTTECFEDDMTFAVENGKLCVYKAAFKNAGSVDIKTEPKEKIGEIVYEYGITRFKRTDIAESDETKVKINTLIPEYGSEYVEMKADEAVVSSYDQLSSSLTGIGVWFKFESPKYPVTVSTENGKFRIYNYKGGGLGSVNDMGKTYTVDRIGEVCFAPESTTIPDNYKAEVKITGEENGKTVDLGTLIITKNNNGTDGVLSVTFKKAGTNGTTADKSSELDTIRKQLSDFFAYEKIDYSVIPKDKMPAQFADKYVFIKVNTADTSYAIRYDEFLKKSNINSELIKSIPYKIDSDTELNKIRALLYCYILENNINASVDPTDEEADLKNKTVLVKYADSEKTRTQLENFLKENNIDLKLVEFYAVE